MQKDLDKNYNPSIEQDIYKNWLDKKYFHAKIDKTKKPYTIILPPPNITGNLHMGHALDSTMQDILIRFKRMQGFNALWIPGTDHASISTEVKIVDKMASEGLKKEDIGREEFLKRAWAWKEEYGENILNQLKKLGNSCDWDRVRFTLDEGCSKAVLKTFVKLYKKGAIYKGEKLINWCPKCKTTISDAEVIHNDKDGNFWHIKYRVKDSDSFLEFATTRPETMLGDSAVAVNPNDERYKSFIGKTCIVPFVDREIPIIADDYVDMEFGTGVVKITPAHDPNDFEVGERHNLKKINIFNDDGTINQNGGKFKGLYRYDAREKIVQELKQMGLLVKVKPISHSVGSHERCGDIIEPLIKNQWFVKMKELAKPALDAYYSKNINFVPERFSKIYTHWLENIKDWCISRQLWWGHRIPAYYCECGNIEVSYEQVEKCPKCMSEKLLQDEDTLDTWFSSALWPFSTLGWPENTEDFEYFYPTNVLVTGYDIIFFWVVRMVFSAIEHTGEVPFNDVLIHGLVRDSQGRKMSKSLGNGVDPLDVIDKYGADALRLMLMTGNSPGNDLRFYWEKLDSSRNFLNKIWNATRFILMNIEDENIDIDLNQLVDEDKWILSKANSLVKEVTKNIEAYDFGVAVTKIYDFVWDEYCDWYIEMVKPRLYNKDDKTRKAALWTLKQVLITYLKLLHPFVPFITEQIFTSIQDEEETIVLSSWPEFKQQFEFKKEEDDIELIKNTVKSIRNLRAEMNVLPSKKVKVLVFSNDQTVLQIFEKSKLFFKTLAYASEIVNINDNSQITKNFVSVVIPNAVIYMPFDELVDLEKEQQRLEKEQQKLISEVKRVEGKLSNAGFISKAPAKLIEEEKEKLLKYNKMLKEVQEQLKNLKIN